MPRRLLACWQAEHPAISRIELTVRSAVIRTAAAEGQAGRSAVAAARVRELKANGGDEPRDRCAPISAVHEALGGSPLDPRLTFETFVVGRSNTLAHAAAKQVAQARRGDAVMFNPLYVHAGVGLGKTHLLQSLAWAGNATRRAQGALPHGREIHVRLRRRAAHAERARLQGSAARHRRAGDRRPAVPAGQVDPGRILPHAQCADRRRPAGRDRRRPAAVRPRKPRRARALAARRRAGGRDGLARRGTAAGNPQIPRRRGQAASSRLRRAARRCSPSSPRP